MQVITGGFKAYINQKCEAGLVRRRAWVGLTSEEFEVLIVLGQVPYDKLDLLK